ncbi:MAG: SusD/RagB family nutrient-binding outer membrane lipoprotein [Flavobacteriaceae bacterium]
MNKKFLKFLLVVFTVSIWGCETVDLNQTENPSTIGAQFLEPKFAFNYVQLQLPTFVDESNSFTQTIMRQMAMIGGNTYNNAYAPVNFNSQWSTAYNIINAVKFMEPKALQEKRYLALGASKIIRCYVLMTLVDMYGNVPYTQAALGNANITPRYDDDEFVYEAILNELDEAIVTLGNEDKNSDNQDLYYGGSATKWIKLANTLKLKMYNNCNLLSTIGAKNVANEVNAIIAEDKIINTKEDDFAFQYGNSRFTPNTRHPLYNDQYELNGGSYIANYMMWTVTSEKGNPSTFPNTITDPGDPRANYYFVRQNSASLSNASSTIIPGKNKTRPDHYNDLKYRSFYDQSIRTPFTVSNWSLTSQTGMPGDGFLGRDHGDNSGIPQDSDLRAVAGTYPIGGVYNTSGGSVQSSGTKGKQGAGIMPIMLSSFVHFIKSELMLKGIISGNAQDELDLAVSQSIDKTVNLFSDYPVLSANATAALPGKITRYRDFIGNQYENLDPDKRLELVIKEYYIAAWGNGIEPYNNYRRTGYPSNLQPTLEPVSGPFYNCAFYSGSSVNNNPNTPVNDRTRKVFWAAPNVVELN